MSGLKRLLTTTLLSGALLAGSAHAGGLHHEIEKAHGGAAWNAQQALQADIVVEFGGRRMIDGRLTMDTPGGKTRFDLKDGTVLVFDGEQAYKAPASSAFQGTRFHVLTWSYFLAAPMKLDDAGSSFEELGSRPFEAGRSLDAGRLTFGDGVGDSPDDWYVVYADDSRQLAGMAYIVTFGKDLAEANKDPHAVIYRKYEEVDGVRLSTRWQFYNWSEDKGAHGDPIGEVTLANLSFVTPDKSTFKAPAGAE
ncbi:MAG: hypothetical protein AAF725_06815, partial [Acidobacteriota bacterium]